MPAPTSIAEVEALALKLQREGFLSAPAKAGREWVQVRYRREVLCAQVVRLLPGTEGRRPSYMVETLIGPAHVDPMNVRACSSLADGRCTCAATRGDEGATGRGARAVPLGNTGITVVRGARG